MGGLSRQYTRLAALSHDTPYARPGLFFRPNASTASQFSPRVQQALLDEHTERVIASMAGGLRDYEFESFRGERVKGSDAGEGKWATWWFSR